MKYLIAQNFWPAEPIYSIYNMDVNPNEGTSVFGYGCMKINHEGIMMEWNIWLLITFEWLNRFTWDWIRVLTTKGKPVFKYGFIMMNHVDLFFPHNGGTAWTDSLETKYGQVIWTCSSARVCVCAGRIDSWASCRICDWQADDRTILAEECLDWLIWNLICWLFWGRGRLLSKIDSRWHHLWPFPGHSGI